MSVSDSPSISKGRAWLSLARHAATLYQRDANAKQRQQKKTEGDANFRGRSVDAEIILQEITKRLLRPNDDPVLSFSQRLGLLELSLLIAYEYPEIKIDTQKQVVDILGQM